MGGGRQRQREIVLLEGLRVPAPVEAHQAEDRSVQFQRHHDHGVGPGRLDQPRALGGRAEPGRTGTDPYQAGPEVRHGQRVGRTGGQPHASRPRGRPGGRPHRDPAGPRGAAAHRAPTAPAADPTPAAPRPPPRRRPGRRRPAPRPSPAPRRWPPHRATCPPGYAPRPGRPPGCAPSPARRRRRAWPAARASAPARRPAGGRRLSDCDRGRDCPRSRPRTTRSRTATPLSSTSRSTRSASCGRSTRYASVKYCPARRSAGTASERAFVRTTRNCVSSTCSPTADWVNRLCRIAAAMSSAPAEAGTGAPASDASDTDSPPSGSAACPDRQVRDKRRRTLRTSPPGDCHRPPEAQM